MEKYTDQEFFYKQTPVNYDGIAKFTSIKGNTLGWNQSIKPFESANWEGGNASTSFSNGTVLCTCTEVGGFGVYRLANTNPANWQVGHVYFLSVEAKCNKTGRLRFPFNVSGNDSTISETGKWVRYSYVATCPQNVPNTLVCFKMDNVEVGDTLEARNPMKIDLTQMYGSGNEPTADEFLSLFSLPYYDYNQGTLIPFNGNGIKTTANLLETSKLEIGKNWTYGSASNRAIWQFDCQPETEYHIDLSYSSAINNAVMVYKSGYNTNQLSNVPVGTQKSVDIITPSGCYVVCIQFESGTSVMTTDDIYSQCRAYLKGKESITDLPISTYFPTGMKSAGNVYDELLPNKAITRIGRVDLGSLDWTYASDTGHLRFVCEVLSDAKKPSSGNTYANILCSRYNTCTESQVYGNTVQGICLTTTGRPMAYDSSYTDATTFKNAMSGVYLYYELATETETDAEDFFYKFYADGTEQLLPVNESSPSTSYLIADIEYYDSTEGDSLYRRFWLINGDGERWDLTDKEFKSFLNNPTGLGFRKTIEITRYGEKANKNNEVYDFPQPSGELLFYDTYNSTRYDKYNKFIRFLMSQPITLYYMIPVSYISGIANIFTLNCDVTEVQKTESKTDHILTSSIVFNGLGFYEGDEISVNGTTDTYTLTNEGDFPVGFEITVEGSLTKPYITLSQDGELYGEAKFVGTDAYNSLYLNSNDGEQNIILQQGGSVIPNPLSYQDLSISNGSIYVTFVKLAKGVSELSIGVESGSITNVNIKYSPKYRSV